MRSYFSSFIDQELSSDFGSQYQFYFSFCEKTKNIKNKKHYEIEFPIHFRYQPPLSTEAYSNISLPLAKISIIPYKSMGNKFNIEKFCYEKMIDPKTVRGITALLNEINQYEVYLLNKENLLHLIPVGNSSILFIVSFITCIISTIGFMLIFIEIIFKREDSKEKMN